MKATTVCSLILFLVTIGCHIPSLTGELFTAIVDLQKLLQTEESIARLLNDYIQAEESRIQTLKDVKANYDKIHFEASKDSENYLSNPVNAFLLVKRLTTDWKRVEHLLVQGPTESSNNVLKNLTTASSVDSFPSAEDFSGAADALIRLQDTYQLKVSDIAKGNIPSQFSHHHQNRDPNRTHFLPSPSEIELTANDCYELGRHSYINRDHHHTVLWMKESLNRLGDKTADETDILEHLAFSEYHLGHVREALKLTEKLLAIAPFHSRAHGNVKYYEKMLKDKEQQKLGDDGSDSVPDDGTHAPHSEVEVDQSRSIYDSLCRGEKRMLKGLDKDLICFYADTKSTPYHRLMKFKVEEAFKKPHILMFYDTLTDTEIAIIKSLAGPRLKRATVQNSLTGQLETASYRISKSAWLKEEEDPVIDRVNKRIELLTGLTTETAEDLQVVNYGIGGHYDAHYDFARKEETKAFESLGTGNRIATWLNYMSDVEAGGATVFPELGVTLWPKKGATAFWWNLHRNGEGDMMTRHAACPVLMGSKWVSNKWFHERGQEFRRSCGLRVNS